MRGAERFTLIDGAPRMQALVTLGHGGTEQLRVCEVPVPVPGPGEVLLQVVAATFALADIARAQEVFLQKRHAGNFVLVPAALPA